MKLKKYVLIILALTLFFTEFFYYASVSEAATVIKTVQKTVSFTDLAYYDVWKHEDGTWQKGIKPGSPASQSYPISESVVEKGAKIVSITGTFDSTYNKNPYGDYCVLAANVSNLTYEYSPGTTKNKDTAGIQYSINTTLISRSGTNGLNIKVPGQAENVEGYKYYIPIKFEIKYTIEVNEEIPLETGSFELTLDVPSSAKQGDDITVETSSAVDELDGMKFLTLEKRLNGGDWELLKTWTGTGALGVDLGGSIKDTLDEVGKYDYRSTGKDINDIVKKLIKSVNVGESREVSLDVKINAPQQVPEGHTFLVADESIYTVNGVDYSSAAAYALGIASGRLTSTSSTVSIKQLTSTKYEVMISQAGTISLSLRGRIDGETAYDTAPVEAYKTPVVIDNLSGFQKQNRKQVLDITVATYPGKPLTEFSIELKDKVTGEQIRLTQDNLQENNSTIKTRTVTMTQDLEKGFAYITLEFLTKTPAYRSADPSYTQDFYYEINVKDSKGDTDQASKTFPVKPDLPPVPAISMDTAFLRAEGTNQAAIKAEDVTVAADGDEVERTWYFGHGLAPASYTNIATIDGYQKLSFGTDKIVGFNKTGVGKFTTKLFVKEKWTEPTLEEYVTDADHLTGVTTASSDVLNVAPVVSLELLRAKEKDVLLLANNDTEYISLINKKTELLQALLANKIDAKIIIKKLLGSTPGDVNGITPRLTLQFPAPLWESGMADEIEYYQLSNDSEKAYVSVWTWINEMPTVPVSVQAYSPYSGLVWQYTTNRAEQFTFGSDDTGNYLYLIYKGSNQTLLLDKRTGAVSGTLPTALPDKVWLTDQFIFGVENGNLYTIHQNTMAKTQIDANVSMFARVGGTLQYITRTATGVFRNTLNPNTLAVTKDLLADADNGKGNSADYTAACIDSSGNAVFYKAAGRGTDSFSGIRIYSPENKLVKEIALSISELKGIYAPLDESGNANHILLREKDDDRHYFIGVNLQTGQISTERSSDVDQVFQPTFFQIKGVSYLYYPGWFLTNALYYHGQSHLFTFDGTTMSERLVPGPGMIDRDDEKFTASDRILTTLFGDNTTRITTIRLSALPKTLAQETAEVIAQFSGKNTFVGGTYTTAEQIKATADAPEPMVKITANNDGNLSLTNLSLSPGKKYYYEYVLKPLTSGTKDRLSGITASTGTVTSNQNFLGDTLYVTDSYEEDFNDSKINSFFTVNDPGRFEGGWYGAYNNGSRDNDNYMNLSFNVPAGKEAILSFDYKLDSTVASYYDESNIFIDGMRMDEKKTTNTLEGHKIFYKILSAGTHTIEIKVSARNWWYFLMDNLKVDILSVAPEHTGQNLVSGEGSDGWLTVSGDFKIPTKTISYGAQESYPYYGGLPSRVVEYLEYKGNNYPEEIQYTETVPQGYLQKGWVYLRSNYLYSYPKVTYNIAGSGKYEYTQDGSVDQWVYMEPKSAGSYNHSVAIKRANYYQGWIEAFSLITYLDNEITRTGNIAFNGSNTRYFFPKVTSTEKTNLNMYLPRGEYYLKNLRVYYMENGQKVYLENKALENITELKNWSLSSGLTATNISVQEEEKDDEYIKVYKKGEKVLYNIFYDDYEKDPSKAQYWQYGHINWPPDTVHPDVGKVLTAPIDRFFLSGKYTVNHWQQDNTQRPGTVGDAAPYDKESNKVSMTFYINGEGKAPWITYIKTNPATVKENNSYSILVGVDDAEKDTLTLETEVYLNGKSIRRDVKTGITANGAGAYPELTVSGLPKAEVGVYQVICTVSDYSGTGIKSYKFTVISEGKITGYVNHTDQWDKNRKKYNLKRFEDEINRSITIDEYKGMTPPRRRGINVFWSGERFMLLAETEGSPSEVTVKILKPDGGGILRDTGYSGMLRDSGRKTSAGAALWEGSLWNQSMINLWGRKEPEVLTFIFTAHYGDGNTKAHSVSIIVDTERDYWQLHRLW